MKDLEVIRDTISHLNPSTLAIMLVDLLESVEDGLLERERAHLVLAILSVESANNGIDSLLSEVLSLRSEQSKQEIK